MLILCVLFWDKARDYLVYSSVPIAIEILSLSGSLIHSEKCHARVCKDSTVIFD